MRDLAYFEKDYNGPTARRLYEEYMLEYRKRQMQSFFELHHDEQWFIEEYDPTVLSKHFKNLFRESQEASKAFVRRYREENASAPDLDQEDDQRGDELTSSLRISGIPVSVEGAALESAIGSLENVHLKRFFLSSPDGDDHFSRYASATFASKEDATLAATGLEEKLSKDLQFTPKVDQLQESQLYRTPALCAPLPSRDSDRMEKDLATSNKLRVLLDAEKKIEGENSFFEDSGKSVSI